MRLATVKNGSPDGRLMVISDDEMSALPVPEWGNLRYALESWDRAFPAIQDIAARLQRNAGLPLNADEIIAPLPRTWQWLDGSAFQTHAQLMQVAFNTDPLPNEKPLMYQGLADRFYGPNQLIPFRSETDGIDFEGEFGVVVDRVPMGTTADDAMQHIKLIVQINDWSLRALAVPEMLTGFGWVQAKPACSMAPYAITPDELGDAWANGRVCLDLLVEWNGRPFGSANGREMSYGFHELIAHAAATRDLAAGTVIGSGTVANANYAEVGSSCISERRAIEIIRDGAARTAFMAFGDVCQMQAVRPDGTAPFGVMNNRVVSL